MKRTTYYSLITACSWAWVVVLGNIAPSWALCSAVGKAVLPESGRGASSAMAPVSVAAGALTSGREETLLCAPDTSPCEVDFVSSVSPQNAFRWFFEAKAAASAGQRLRWDFGNGATAEGASVEHTFSQEGYYSVCLTLSDSSGCYRQRCRSVWVGEVDSGGCGYEVVLTVSDLKLQGRLVATTASSPPLRSVRWFMAKTGVLLSDALVFTTTLPGEGVYYICAQYETEDSSCTTTRCRLASATASSSCLQPALAQLMTQQVCPSFYSPVCGCNGVTYANECTAMAAGVARWRPGECSAPGEGTCIAELKTELSPATSSIGGYELRCFNRSAGPYQVAQIDFGDGSPLWVGSAADTVIEHHYAKSGLYRINLTVWRNDHCISSVDRIIATDAGSWKNAGNLITDYVFPGDANGDRRANAYDLLPIGLGFARTGAPRPFASTAWRPQFAPNWHTPNLIVANFKHADADGNGVINEFDRAAIEQNYTPIPAADGDGGAAVGAPLWVDFLQDSVVISPQAPGPVVITADVKVGHVHTPVHGLYGLAFALRYPEFVSHDPEVFYSNNSFMGAPGSVLLFSKDVYSRRQMDLGFARKNGTSVSGYGSIARIQFATDFVIIIDVIERSGSLRLPFTVSPVGVRGIDAQGNPIAMHGAVLDTLWLVLDKSVSAQEERQPSGPSSLVYPNPASEAVWVAVGSATLEKVDVFDVFGRLILTHRPTGMHTTRLETHHWQRGWYLLRISTSEGVVEKRLLVHGVKP